MAGRGPAPKERHTRASNDVHGQALQPPLRNRNHYDVVCGNRKIGPNLPNNVLPINKKTGKRQTWNPQTKKWWEHWRRSPQAARMLTEPDWDYLLDTALMHHLMWTYGRWEYANEIRIRVANFGATPADRARLQYEIEVPDLAPAGKRTDNVSDIRSAGRRRSILDS